MVYLFLHFYSRYGIIYIPAIVRILGVMGIASASGVVSDANDIISIELLTLVHISKRGLPKIKSAKIHDLNTEIRQLAAIPRNPSHVASDGYSKRLWRGVDCGQIKFYQNLLHQ